MFNTFGGSPVAPGQIAYAAIALASNLALSWPNFQGTSNVYATIMDVTPSGGGFAITMPDATLAGVGTAALIRNLGGSSFDVKDFSGNTIATVAPGVAKFIWITNNSTQAGTWAVITFGTGSSAIDASTIVGMGLQVIGATLNQAHPTNLTSATITISSASLASVFIATGGSVACNLPTSVSVGTKFFFILKNGGTGTVTLTPSGGDTVDGASTVALAPNDACIVYATGNGNAWYTAGLGRNVNFAFTLLSKSVAGNTDVTLTSAECANKVINLTGVLTGNINVIVTNTVSVYYIFNNTSGSFSLTVKTAAGTGVAVVQGAHDILACDGTNVYRAITNTAATTAFSTGSAAGPSVTFIGRTDTGLYSPAAGQVALTAGGFEVLQGSSQPASVNWLDVTATATGVAPIIAADGTDASVGITLKPKGTGATATLNFLDGNGNNVIVTGPAVAGAVNFFTPVNAATGTNPQLKASGTDPNVGMRFVPKGTGRVQVTDGTDATKVSELDVSGLTTGTVRTYKLPDVSDTLVTLGVMQSQSIGPQIFL